MLKKRWVLMAAILVVGFVLGLSTSALTEEKHPQIHAAMRALRQAANHLERAAHEFGGHRAKALELVKQAEQELKEALVYAKEHPAPGGKPGAAGQATPSGQPAPAKTQ